jgi:hypothetical protein
VSSNLPKKQLGVARGGSGWLGVARGGSGWLGLNGLFPIYYLKGEDRNTSPKKLFVVMRTVVLKYEHSVLSSVNFKRTFWWLIKTLISFYLANQNFD